MFTTRCIQQAVKITAATHVIKFSVLKVVHVKKSYSYLCLNNSHKTIRLKMNTQGKKSLGSAKESFRFTDYDCIGFDLDNTICRYKIGPMIKLEYEAMAKFLVEKKGYDPVHLYKSIEDNLDFMLKGLILDVENGNVLRIDPDGIILHGTHGTKELNKEQLAEYYGAECRWHPTDMFSKDPLHTWNGPMSDRMRTLLDYFDMPAGLVFARAVDTIDEQKGGAQKSYTVWPDILEALQDMFHREHFQLSKGGYFPDMKASPENYIHKCSSELINWFKALKKRNILLFLITGSNVDFASHTAEYSMGTSWRDLFDIVVCFAKKPGFFIQNRPFILVDGFNEIEQVEVEDLKRGGIYTHGNFAGLHTFLKKYSKEEPKILYVGDNLVQDVYAPSVHTPCDAVAVCEELEAEGVYGHDQFHHDESYLVSSKWGSYFSHGNDERLTIWKNMIEMHAKLAVPSLEYVAKNPVHYSYTVT